MRFFLLSLLFVSLGAAYAQSSTSSQASTSQMSTSSPSPSVSLSLTTGLTTATVATRVGAQTSQVVTVFPIVFNVTSTLTPLSTSTSSNTLSSASSSATPSAVPFVLATKVDPAFGVLGAILILTGLPSAFWGHKNRWTSFFLIGFYSLSLVCIVLILKFGVIPAINPPSKTLRGMFVLASAVAGIAGGAIAIFFWKAARYGIGAWGGFAVALWIQCFQNGGVVKPIGFRWILYIGCGVIGFVLCAIPRIHYHILLVSTAFVGSSAFILGVDCFTTAGLKEFYIWNLGFPGLFPKYVNNHIQFPVSQTMEIELGLIGAISLMGIAVQLRILKVLERKLHEIGEEAKRQDQDAELQASTRFKEIEAERFAWEKDHPTLGKHGRQESALSSMPLMPKDGDESTSPTIPDPSSYTLAEEGRRRHLSGVSDFKVAPISDEEPIRVSRFMQNPGALPTLDLGLGIQEDVPSSFIADEDRHRKDLTNAEWEDLKHKKELLAEIQTIRRSIDVLKSESPIPSSSEQSRRPSLSSKRTLSVDASSALLPLVSHSRPPRELDPRARVHSMEMSALSRSPALSDPISRPTSTPLRNDWDTYIEERKLLQPPAGVTPPIATTSLHSTKIPIPTAVQDAIAKRKQRESALEYAEHGNDSSDDITLSLAKVPLQKRQSTGGHVPVTIIPPRRHAAPIVAPVPQRPPAGRTRTFEELNERHREKMRDMQAPLTRAEREHAELETAKQRWERSKALEKEAVTRRQAEKASAMEKRKRSGEATADGVKQRSTNNPRDNRHSRSLSADKLAALGTSSRRLSTLKVEDWQRYQQEGETKADATSGGFGDKRDSRALRSEGVPFPDTGKGSGSYPRRTTKDRLTWL